MLWYYTASIQTALLFLKKSLVIGVRRPCRHQFNISDSNTCQPETGAKRTNSAHTSKRTKARISICSPSMLQSSFYLTGTTGAWVGHLTPTRSVNHVGYTYTYSGLRIDGQIPSRILDVSDDSKLSNSEMATREW